jgi:large subunit ribosomal protein L17
VRHGCKLRNLSRSPSHRMALMRNMSTSLLDKEKIVTTIQKAKEIRPVVERLITLGKKSDLHAKRQAYSFLTSKPVVHKLFNTISPRYQDRHGGYLRITRIGNRPGDNAEMAVIEFV